MVLYILSVKNSSAIDFVGQNFSTVESDEIFETFRYF